MPSLGEPLDIYAAARKRMQTYYCHCGNRSVYRVSDDPSDEKIYLTGRCQEHINDGTLDKRFIEPRFHPSMPSRFKDTDPLRLHPSMQAALAWSPAVGKPGLLMHGTSGIGKTRAAWHVSNRLWLSGLGEGCNMRLMFLPMREFERRMIDSFEERRHAAALDEVSKADFLVLDDLGKERLTSRMATDLFSVIDHRTERDMPTVITTNYSGKAFIDRFTPHDKETGIAIGRRIRDYFTIQGMSHEQNKE